MGGGSQKTRSSEGSGEKEPCDPGADDPSRGESSERGQLGHGLALDGSRQGEHGGERMGGLVFGGLREGVDEKKARGRRCDEKMTRCPESKQRARDLMGKMRALDLMRRGAWDSPPVDLARVEGPWRKQQKQGPGRT